MSSRVAPTDEYCYGIAVGLLTTSNSYSDLAKQFDCSISFVNQVASSVLTPEERWLRRCANTSKARQIPGYDNSNNYVLVRRPAWYNANTEYVREHQVVWCLYNNVSRVPDGYNIHHKDHNKRNNAIENLELMTASEHTLYHKPTRW